MRRKRPSGTLNRIFSNLNSLFILVIVVNLLQSVQFSAANTIQEDYEECRNSEKFGNVSLICDPEKKFQSSTLRSLDNLLRNLQKKMSCECENQCYRGENLSNKYIGLLIVTSTEKINALSDNQSENDMMDEQSHNNIQALTNCAAKIYEDAKLGNDQCDNGLLIFYDKDQKNFATYRGKKRFALLNDNDIKRLQQVASDGPQSNSEDEIALKYLLSNYEETKSSDKSIFRSDSWTFITGLILTLVLVLFLVALLNALLLAKFCCCCSSKSDKKEKYYVNQTQSYKTIEPIYIVTPALSQHDAMSVLHQQQENRRLSSLHHSPMSMMNGDFSIYNSPYGTSRTPHPPSIYPPPPPIIGHSHVNKGPIITHLPRSRSITPTFTHRTKIRPQRSTSSTFGSQVIRQMENTHQENKHDQVNRTSTVMSKNGNGTYFTTPNMMPHYAVTSSHNSPDNSVVALPSHKPQPSTSQIQSNSLSESEDPFPLPFLDPHRKREVQTKKEYIL